MGSVENSIDGSPTHVKRLLHSSRPLPAVPEGLNSYLCSTFYWIKQKEAAFLQCPCNIQISEAIPRCMLSERTF